MIKFFQLLLKLSFGTVLFFSPVFLLPQLQFLGSDTSIFVFTIGIFFTFFIWSLSLFITKKFLPPIPRSGIWLRQTFYLIPFTFSLIVFANLYFSLNPQILLIPPFIRFLNAQSILPGLLFISLSITVVLAGSVFSNRKIFLLLLLPAFLFSLYQIYPFLNFQKSSYILPVTAGIKIASETLRNNLWLGAGPGLFESTYRLYKPLTINSTPLWNYNFTSSSNEYLEILTTMGLLGFFSYLLLIVWSFLKALKDKSWLIAFLIPLFCIINIFVPPLFSLRLLLFAIVGLAISNNDLLLKGFISKKLYIVHCTLYIVMLPIIFLLLKYSLAEYYFTKSTKASLPNNTYYYQNRAITLFTHLDKYHRSYAQTSLAYTDSLLKQETSPSAKTIKLTNSLIAQSINEANNAIKLSPANSTNLASAALIYKNLIGIVPKAEDFSLAFFQQAIKKDPVNPDLQTQVGNIYMSKNDYEQAEKFFHNALLLHPKDPMALFGLALIEKNQGQKIDAMKYLTQALEDIPIGTADYIKVKNLLHELEEIQTNY